MTLAAVSDGRDDDISRLEFTRHVRDDLLSTALRAISFQLGLTVCVVRMYHLGKRREEGL